MKHQTRKGFTLIEILVVCTVVALLSALLLPVMSNARQSARRATSTSNLRQCGLALRMYCDDYGGTRAMPTGLVAAQVLKNAPTYDPNDTWRHNSEEKFGSPLIGSYAYVREIDNFKTQQQWDDVVTTRGTVQQPLMVSIYYASVVPDAFHGMQYNLDDYAGKSLGGCYMPDRILRLNLDGSVSSTRVLYGYSGTKTGSQMLMNWPHIFFDFDPNLAPVTSSGPRN